jgi:short subunit dehydrogenase-like uncharacterized protein
VSFLIYGANGYTGQLVAETAVARGHRPLLAGRSAEAVGAVAGRLGLAHRAVPLDDAGKLRGVLSGMQAVLHCAGPFSRTSRPMADACLRSGVHYLDVTGEISVFESLAVRDAEAQAAGVMLLPGSGFDVVPSDCLAAHLKRRLPCATSLTLAFAAVGGSLSRGTATTMLENFPRGGMVRRGGQLVRVPPAYRDRVIDFGPKRLSAMTIPWGDVSTAFHSTGIPDVEVYTAVHPRTIRLLRLLRPFAGLVGAGPVQRALKRRIDAGPAGPTPAQRAAGGSLLWGEARDASGASVVSRLQGPEGYALTALAMVQAVERVLKGQARPGFKTPSLAFGPDFVLEIEGVVRSDA